MTVGFLSIREEMTEAKFAPLKAGITLQENETEPLGRIQKDRDSTQEDRRRTRGDLKRAAACFSEGDATRWRNLVIIPFRAQEVVN